MADAQAAYKPKSARKRPLTMAEMRAKAVYRAMEKILEECMQNDAQLWSIVRVMSGDEYLQAAEERSLAGFCGHALCSSQPMKDKTRQLDLYEKKIRPATEGAGFCGSSCAAAAQAFAGRLGTNADAMHRFERLMQQLKDKHGEFLSNTIEFPAKGAKINAKSQPEPATSDTTSDDAKKPKSALKNTQKLAAGNSKVPILAAEVKERSPEEEMPAAGNRGEGLIGGTPGSIEGYKPRRPPAGTSENSDRERRRVRFSGEGRSNESIRLTPEDASVAVERNHELSDGAGKSGGRNGGNEERTAAAHSIARNELDAGQRAVFVLDVEDATGPIEGARHTLEAKLGSMRLANESEIFEAGVDVSSDAGDLQAGIAQNGNTRDSNGEAHVPVDQLLTERLRQGAAKYFPHLAASLPDDLLQKLDEDHSESDAEPSDVESDWMLSDDDSDQQAPSGGHMSLFLHVYTHIDSWITGSTLELLLQPTSLSGSKEAAPPPATASVPEILGALGRFLALALPPLLERLQCGLPRGEVERALGELIATFQLTGALPAFRSVEWQLVALILLKALSLERLPQLRQTFETRDGIHRMFQALGEYGFTAEEFAAVLELFAE